MSHLDTSERRLLEERAKWLATAVAQAEIGDAHFGIQSMPVDWKLLPKREVSAVATAGCKRRSEFAAGRAAARRALASAGFQMGEIPIGLGGSPEWPLGTTGSISHAGPLAIAVVADVTKISAIGIDIEEISAVGPEIWPEFMTARELAEYDRLPPDQRRFYGAYAFCAKEALFKYQYPHTEQWVDFHEVELVVDDAGGGYVHCARGLQILGRWRNTFPVKLNAGANLALAIIYTAAASA